MKRQRWMAVFGLGCLLLGLGCGASTSNEDSKSTATQSCTVGTSAMCTCSDQTAATMTCLPGGVYGACACAVNNSNSGGAAGTGGALVNSGGTVGSTGGVVNNTGGVVPVTGGVAPITGGMMNATGGAMTGTGGVMTNTGNTPVMLPTAQGSCPTLTNGANSITLNSTAMSWKLWVGTKAATPTGPIVIYWHGTGTNSDEVTEAIGMAGVNEVVSLGGVVASADVTSNTGTNTGDNVWFTGDVDYADQIIACAMQQLNIDTRHIHTSGYSAGALQVGYMYGARSGYLASAVVYSGGDSGLGAFGGGGGTTLVDPTNLAPVIGAHGSTSGDFLAGSTTSWEQTLRTSGTFVIDCDDGGSHVDITRLINLGPSAWQFFKDHPFKVGMPDPYAGGIPASFPASSNCSIVP